MADEDECRRHGRVSRGVDVVRVKWSSQRDTSKFKGEVDGVDIGQMASEIYFEMVRTWDVHVTADDENTKELQD